MKSMEKLCWQLALRDRTAGKRRWSGTVTLAARTGIFSRSDHVDHDPRAPSKLDSKTLFTTNIRLTNGQLQKGLLNARCIGLPPKVSPVAP